MRGNVGTARVGSIEVERAMSGIAEKHTSVDGLRTAHTRPAPPSEPSAIRTDVPSARPTSLPEFEMNALASGALRLCPVAALPLNTAVPVRVEGAELGFLDHASAFLVMHVDGVSPLDAIAQMTQMPLSHVVDRFLELQALGVVELATAGAAGMPAISGLFRRA